MLSSVACSRCRAKLMALTVAGGSVDAAEALTTLKYQPEVIKSTCAQGPCTALHPKPRSGRAPPRQCKKQKVWPDSDLPPEPSPPMVVIVIGRGVRARLVPSMRYSPGRRSDSWFGTSPVATLITLARMYRYSAAMFRQCPALPLRFVKN